MDRDSRYRAEDRGDDDAVAEIDRMTELRNSTHAEERRRRYLAALHREKVHGPGWKSWQRIPKEETDKRVAKRWRYDYRNRSTRG